MTRMKKRSEYKKDSRKKDLKTFSDISNSFETVLLDILCALSNVSAFLSN